MKIGVFFPSGKLGGAEQVLLQIVNAYADNGADVYVYLLTDLYAVELKSHSRENIHIKVFKAHREINGIWKLLKYFTTVRNKIVFDYLYTSHVHLNAYVSLLRRLSIIKVKRHVARESTSIFKRFDGLKLRYYNMLYNIGYPNIDLIICQTEEMKDNLIQHKSWLKKSNIVVLANPITPLDSSLSLSNPLPEKEYAISAGRLIPEKGFDILISSFEKILQSFPSLELVILGEGKERTRLEEQIVNLGLTQKIHLIGWQENVYRYFRHAKICVVSSRIEGFPNVLLQMMMMNTTVVSTLCAGGVDKINGIHHAKVDDEDGLSSAILAALSDTNEQARILFDNYLTTININNYISSIESLIQ